MSKPAQNVRDGIYLPTLDGWRAIAIGFVILAHAAESISAAFGFHIPGKDQIGAFGVRIFFGLSGFLITNRLLADENKYGQISLKSFYFRRAFRILPASLAFLSVVGVLAWVKIIHVSASQWVSALLFSNNYYMAYTGHTSWYLGHFWSLAVEEHFYFIWPLAFLLLAQHRGGRGRIYFAIAIGIGVSLWRIDSFTGIFSGVARYSDSYGLNWARTDYEGDYIAWGCVVALIYSDAAWKARIHALLVHPFTTPILVALLAATFIKLSVEFRFISLTLSGVLIPFLVLGIMLHEKGFLFKMLEAPFSKLIGRLSYSLYLWQQLFLVGFITGRTLQSFPLNLVMAFICAGFSMMFIEKPMIKLGHRIVSPCQGKIQSQQSLTL